jgi:hypothetical protein
MQVFFSHLGGDPNHTTLTVINSKNDTPRSRIIPIRDPRSLTQALAHREPRLKTRVIVADYKESFSIDRRLVDILGSFYDIDPLVLEHHFRHDAIWIEDSFKSSRHIVCLTHALLC